MSTDIVDLDQMMATLAQASKDPNGVTVGEFANAVQSLQAELKMLETEVNRLGGTVNAAFRDDDAASDEAETQTAASTEADAAEEGRIQAEA